MARKLKIGWTLTQQSYRVLISHKTLAFFPVCSGLISLTMLTFLLKPLEALWLTLSSNSPHFQSTEYLIIAGILALLFLINVVRSFFHCAFTACLHDLLKNDSFYFKKSFHTALSALPSTLGWILFHTTIGAFIRLFQQYFKQIKMINRLLNGLLWRFGIYFVPLSLAVQKAGPIEAIRHSSRLMRETFGKGLSSNLGITFTLLIAHLAALLPAYLSYHFDRWLIAGIVASAILSLILMALSSAANTITQTALYLYASEKIAPQPFNGDILAQAFSARTE